MIDAVLLENIERCGQSHVLEYWEELNDRQRHKLVEQLLEIDWNTFARFQSELSQSPETSHVDAGSISPPTHLMRIPKTDAEVQIVCHDRILGDELLSSGKVAVILLSGGQGTRLGFPHPKGMYPIGPVTNKSLFELFADQMHSLTERYGRPIYYLIMTSDSTHDEILSFFEQHDYFGLNRSYLRFFKQGTAPCLDLKSKKLLMSGRDSICTSPDGHGGLLGALLKAGLFDELQAAGVEYLFSHQVDNPLANVCDPAFLGAHLRFGAEVSTKVVAKTDASEKVGVVVERNGRTSIVEYSDLPRALSLECEPNGELRYWAGNTAIHIFNRAFLESIARSEMSLDWHRAIKKIPYLDDFGNQVNSEIENGVKFERFLFDTMPMAETALIVETKREEEFAPLKNRSGDYSPEYVRTQMNRLATDWFQSLGVTVPENATVEVSPRFAVTAQELAKKLSAICDLDFEFPIYLGPTRFLSPETHPDNRMREVSANATET